LKSLAIIPARGGSVGIPRKNLQLLAGKPLISYAVEAVSKSKSIERCIVSTDDQEIARVSKHYGAEIVMRPVELSGDKASSESALIHVLDQLRRKENYKPDYVGLIQCTSPLILPDDIDDTFQALIEEDADSAHAVFPFHGFIWKKDTHNNSIGVNHDISKRLRRQDLSPQYQETGAVYAMKTDGFLKARNRFFGKIAMHIIPEERAIEIDNIFDFGIAESIVNKSRN